MTADDDGRPHGVGVGGARRLGGMRIQSSSRPMSRVGASLERDPVVALDGRRTCGSGVALVAAASWVPVQPTQSRRQRMLA